jgi:hypothetical protein
LPGQYQQVMDQMRKVAGLFGRQINEPRAPR